jgi:hypothetical protein
MSSEKPATPEPEWVRRKRRALLFGEVLPEQTSDDRPDQETGRGRPGDSAGDAWLREQVPPHHGD